MPTGSEGLEASLARIVQELNHLKDGLRLLGLKQCSRCGRYFMYPDGKALFDAGELSCYSCLPEWWGRRSPELRIEERQAVEHKLLRWLVSHYNAKVIRQAEKMPRLDRIEFKIIVACDECNGTGKIAAGAACHHCEGRGSVWMVRLLPELQ